MPIKTQHLGRDAALEDTITSYQKVITDAGFYIVEQSYLNPVANIWSVKVCDRDCSLLSTNGKGNSKKAALASALGKFVEGLSTHYFWADWYLGDEISNSKFVHYAKEQWFKTDANGTWPKGVLNQELQAFYNPDGDLNASKLIDANSSNQTRGICCIPFESVANGDVLNFPINIIDNLYASNGISAGNTVAEARVHALCGIIEHYIQFKVIAEGISLPNISDGVLNRFTNIQTSIHEIESAGYSLMIQDASLGGRYPVLVATLLNPNDQGIYASFGAHPKFEVALERCLNKLLQDRELNQINGFAEAGFDMDEIASAKNLEQHAINANGVVAWKFLSDKSDFEFIDWSKKYLNIDTNEEFKQLCGIIYGEGNDIYVSDFDELGHYTCRILVPGMSELYPADDLVWENNNAGIEVREQILKTNKTHQECEKLIENLEDLNQDDQYLVSSLIGIPADANSIFQDLRIAELITLLALKIQDNERIQEGCEWLIHFKQIDPLRLKTYQCINTLLQLDGMTNYGQTLEKLYTRKILKNALALIDGEDIFPLESDWKMHHLLITAYQKLVLQQCSFDGYSDSESR